MDETEQNYVELTDEDGNVTNCEIVDIVEYEEKTYALLLPVDEDDVYDEEEVILLEYIEDGDDSYFKNIENEDEFNRVSDYIQNLNEDDDEEDV